jgi:hypothetical protein
MTTLDNWLPAPRTLDTRLRGFRWPPEPSEARRLAARAVEPLPAFYADPVTRFRADSRNFMTLLCRAYVERLDQREALAAWESEGGR